MVIHAKSLWSPKSHQFPHATEKKKLWIFWCSTALIKSANNDQTLKNNSKICLPEYISKSARLDLVKIRYLKPQEEYRRNQKRNSAHSSQDVMRRVSLRGLAGGVFGSLPGISLQRERVQNREREGGR